MGYFTKLYRQTPGNGTLYFPSFAEQFYRSDIHDNIYRCRAASQVGTIISRNVHVRGVVRQSYELQVDGKEVFMGNVAFLKCLIPVHVKEFIEISSWHCGDETLTENLDIGESFFIETV